MDINTLTRLFMAYLAFWLVVVECFYDKQHVVGRFLRKAERLFRIFTMPLLVMLLAALHMPSITQSIYIFILFTIPALLVPNAVFYGYPNLWAGTHKRIVQKRSIKQFKELCEKFAQNKSIVITYIEEKDIDGCLTLIIHTDQEIQADLNFELACYIATQDKVNWLNLTAWFASD